MIMSCTEVRESIKQLDSIILCHAENVLLRFPEIINTAAVIITEPPLGIDDLEPKLIRELIPRWYESMERVLKHDGVLFLFLNPLMLSDWIQNLPSTFKVHSIFTIPLYHSISAPKVFHAQQQLILCLTKHPDTNKIPAFDPRVLSLTYADMPILESEKLHPYQKNPDFLSVLIRLCSKPNDLIVDLFAGSGMTALAALMNRRHFICTEMDPNIWEQTQQLLHDAQNDPKLILNKESMQQNLDVYFTNRR